MSDTKAILDYLQENTDELNALQAQIHPLLPDAPNGIQLAAMMYIIFDAYPLQCDAIPKILDVMHTIYHIKEAAEEIAKLEQSQQPIH